MGIYSRYSLKKKYNIQVYNHKILIVLILSLFLNNGCNTIVGTTKGVAKDIISIIPGV